MTIQQDIFFAIDESAPAEGAGGGAVTDPYRGPSGALGWFDTRMSAVVENKTVRLGPTGLSIKGVGQSQRFQSLIIRKNIIRNASWDAGDTIVGIDVSYGINLDVENNLINNTTQANGVIRANFTNTRIENNRNTAGVLRQ